MPLQFDDLTFDSDTRQLWVRGKEVRLSPKAFDLLALLIDQRPRVVSKAEIRERLWPGTFVSDSSLPSLVSEIREAIADRRRKPPLLRTLHGVGYAFRVRMRRSTKEPSSRRSRTAGSWATGRDRAGCRRQRAGPRGSWHHPPEVEHGVAPSRPHQDRRGPCGGRRSRQQERYIRQRPAGHGTHAGRRRQSSANRIAAVYVPPAAAGGINRDALGAQRSSVTTLISDRYSGRAIPAAWQ